MKIGDKFNLRYSIKKIGIHNEEYYIEVDGEVIVTRIYKENGVIRVCLKEKKWFTCYFYYSLSDFKKRILKIEDLSEVNL